MTTEDRATVAKRAAALLAAQLKPRWQPQPHQIPPAGPWTGWLLMAGRGAGKSKACAEYVRQHVNGPACLPGPVPHWISIIAPTLGDGVTSMYEGPGGIRNADPGARLVQAPGGTVIRWPNGSQAKLYGSHTPEDVERLRAGGNSCLAVLEEFATWRYMEQTYDQLRFGLRSGSRPHWIAATTPKPRPLLKRMLAGEIRGIVHTHATMYDNPFLEQTVKDALEETYAGTDIGAQELHGRLIDEVADALWTRATIEETRVRAEEVPDLTRISVGVDPSGGAGEQGIVVVGKSGLVLPGDGGRPQHHGFVLDDRSCKLSPDQWGRRAVQAAIDWEADEVVAETNYGGAMCVATLRTAAEALGVDIPIRTVTATRGKVVRAQPVAALSAQGRWHMAGVFPELEDQLATWYPELGWSPDRLDAMVWPAWQLKLVGTAARGQGFAGWGSGQKADRWWASTVTGMETSLLLLVMSLAVYRGTRLVVADTFPPVLWLRDRLAGGWRDATQYELNDQSWLPMAGREQIFREIDGVPSRYVYRWNWVPQWLADLISCPFCASGWIALVVTAGVWAAVGLPVPVLCWLATWALGGLIAGQEWA